MTEILPQIEQMRMGVDYSFPVRLRHFECAMRPLSNSETVACYAAVGEHMSKLPVSHRTKLTEDNWLAREFIKKASSPYGDFAPKISDPMMDQMSNDEIMFIYREWMRICERCNPSMETLPTEKMKELVEYVKKNPPADLMYQLTELSTLELRNLAFYLLTTPRD